MPMLECLLCLYLKLNFVLIFEAGMSDGFCLVPKVVWRKSSTGLAKVKSNAAVTSNAPVPTSVCFRNLMTGLT